MATPQRDLPRLSPLAELAGSGREWLLHLVRAALDGLDRARGLTWDGAEVRWKPRDCWIGAYFEPETICQMRELGCLLQHSSDFPLRLRVYICVVPCLALRLQWSEHRGGHHLMIL